LQLRKIVPIVFGNFCRHLLQLNQRLLSVSLPALIAATTRRVTIGNRAFPAAADIFFHRGVSTADELTVTCNALM